MTIAIGQIQVNPLLQARVALLEKQNETLLIESTRVNSEQAKKYLEQMREQQAAHGRAMGTSAKALTELRSEYRQLETTSQSQIADLSRRLQAAVQERDVIADQIRKIASHMDASEIERAQLKQSLLLAKERIGRLEKGLAEAVLEQENLSAQLAQEVVKRKHVEADRMNQAEQFGYAIKDLQQELQAVREERNELAVQLPQEVARGDELEIQFQQEAARRKHAEAHREEIAQLRLKIHLVREESIQMNMRSAFCRTVLDATTIATNKVNDLLCSRNYACKNIYVKFREVEERIKEVNLELYHLKASEAENDFFALGNDPALPIEDLKRNRVRQYGLDPYLLILEPEPHFGPRNLTSRQFDLINEPIVSEEAEVV